MVTFIHILNMPNGQLWRNLNAVQRMSESE